MLTFDTSYSYDKISLKIVNGGIKIVRLPLTLQCIPIMISLLDENDKDLLNCIVSYPTKDIVFFRNIPDGLYFVNIFTKTKSEDNLFWSYLQPRSLSVLCKNGRFHFVVSPIINNNRRILSKIPVDSISLKKYLEPSNLSQSDNPSIISLAKKITLFKVTQYQKTLAIHDWVAGNIYYDCDSLMNSSCYTETYSALDVLISKKCVCRGYANLAVALMRAVGIPALGLHCYSLNISTKGGWESLQNQANTANHIIAVAFIDGRWVLMDITWDSDNIFKNGDFSRRHNIGVSRKYFDTTLEMISNTHKFIETGEYV